MQNTKVSFSEEIAKRANNLYSKACSFAYPIDLSYLACIDGILTLQLLLEDGYSERAEEALKKSISKLEKLGICDDDSAQKYIDDAEAKVAFWSTLKKKFDDETEYRFQEVKQKFLDVVQDCGN